MLRIPDVGMLARTEVVALRLTRTSKYFGFGDESDYVVLDGGRVIGRIFLSPQAPANQPWFWTITDLEMKPSVDNRGFSLTREDAMADFKSRWTSA